MSERISSVESPLPSSGETREVDYEPRETEHSRELWKVIGNQFEMHKDDVGQTDVSKLRLTETEENYYVVERSGNERFIEVVSKVLDVPYYGYRMSKTLDGRILINLSWKSGVYHTKEEVAEDILNYARSKPAEVPRGALVAMACGKHHAEPLFSYRRSGRRSVVICRDCSFRQRAISA